MDLNILTNKFEEFNNKLKSDNLKDLNNLNDQIVNFLRKYKSISRDYKFKSIYTSIFSQMNSKNHDSDWRNFSQK